MEDNVCSTAKEDNVLRMQENAGAWVPSAIVLGMALGTAIGVAFDVVYIGLSFGAVLGLLLGLALDHEMVRGRVNQSAPEPPNTDTENQGE